MARNRINPWWDLGLGAWQLGMESASVMTLRTIALAQGGAASTTEANRMVTEKMEAAFALQTLALTGGLGVSPAQISAKTLAHYRKRVRANRRRLAKR